MTLFFVSGNPLKIAEMKKLFFGSEFTIQPFSADVLEVQTEDSSLLVKDKTLKAFSILRKPLFVEHTYLKIADINGFPGGLTSSFWKRLQGDLITKYFGGSHAEAETVICYCDSKKIYKFRGKISGTISQKPEGKSEFQWDTIFIPSGHKQTFAQLGQRKKNLISMRKLAVDQLLEHLRSTNG